MQPKGEQVYRGRHVTVFFELNLAGIAACAVGPELRQATTSVIRDRAMPFAIANSPEHQGTYKGSFDVDETYVFAGGPPLPPMRRVAARLVNSAFHAKMVEVGTKKYRGFHVLADTLNHLHATRSQF